MTNRNLIIIAMISCISVISINYFIFPYYSNNHDEGVYIFQAKMLSEGKLYLDDDKYSDFFDTWFIINDGEKIYPKYTPVHAFILSIFYTLFKDMRLALGFMAIMSTIFLYLTAKEIYGRGQIIICLICITSPLFLILSSLYLSYASSFMLSTIFIFLFIKSTKTDAKKYPILSGLTLSLLFFDRPYDAVLVGTPFIIYLLYRATKDITSVQDIASFKKLTIMVVSFIPIFLLVLLYNNTLTGDPLLFPFNKYEKLDTIGFGLKRVSPYSPVYNFDINSAIDATNVFLFQLLFNWTAAGLIFIMLVILVAIRRIKLSTYEKLLLASFAFIISGNFIFWGPFQMLNWENSIDMFGPMYYFNALIPISILSGRSIDRFTIIRAKPVILLLIIALNMWLLYPKLDLNYKYTEKNEKIFSSIAEAGPNSLIFLPTIYGPYIQHPFGFLLNDPYFNGSVIYSKDMGSRNIQLMKKYEGRNYYTYQLSGRYTESYEDSIGGNLVKLDLIEGKYIRMNVSIINPTDEKYVIAYAWNGGESNVYLLDDNSEKHMSYNVTWNIAMDGISLEGEYMESEGQKVKLSNNDPLIIGSAFSDLPYFDDSKEVYEAYEYRYMFNIEGDDIVVSLPAETLKIENDMRNTDISNVISLTYNLYDNKLDHDYDNLAKNLDIDEDNTNDISIEDISSVGELINEHNR